MLVCALACSLPALPRQSPTLPLHSSMFCSPVHTADVTQVTSVAHLLIGTLACSLSLSISSLHCSKDCSFLSPTNSHCHSFSRPSIPSHPHDLCLHVSVSHLALHGLRGRLKAKDGSTLAHTHTHTRAGATGAGSGADGGVRGGGGGGRRGGGRRPARQWSDAHEGWEVAQAIVIPALLDTLLAGETDQPCLLPLLAS